MLHSDQLLAAIILALAIFSVVAIPASVRSANAAPPVITASPS